MIYVISNRNLTKEADERLFGDGFNKVSQDCVSAAHATFINNKWVLSRLPEKAGIHPVTDICNTLMNQNAPWVFFVHGFNQSQAKNLEKAREIESYGVNVLCFSWPSNPGPNWLILKTVEYKKARINARRSTLALELTLAALHETMKQWPTGKARPPVTLAVHSLGNTLLQHVVHSQEFEAEGRLFKNVLLHQADVANNIHTGWVSLLGDYSRVYVTINENDIVLDAADILETNRLGNTIANLTARGTLYFNFTHAKHVGREHRLWADPASNNTNIRGFFEAVFRGERGEKRVQGNYNTERNVMEVT